LLGIAWRCSALVGAHAGARTSVGPLQRRHPQTDGQTGRQTDRQTDRRTDGRTDGQTDRQTKRDSERQTDTLAHAQTHRHAERERQAGRQTGGQTERERARERLSERESERAGGRRARAARRRETPRAAAALTRSAGIAWQVAILLNLAGSFVLYRRIKKDLKDDLEHGVSCPRPALPSCSPEELFARQCSYC